MACRLFPAVPLCTVLFFWGMQLARSEVGIFSSGKPLNESNTLGPRSWYLGPDGCRVGRPGNLVVTPSLGYSLNGGELLDTQSTGPRLCSWLSTMENAHESMRSAWEREHAARKAQVSWWNIFKKLWLWRRSFPEFKIDVIIRHLDLWNNDRFGHAMPWIAAHFVYECPDADSSYGLMEHLCNTAFSQKNDPRVPETVFLLLQPREGYNQPLKVEADKWQYVAGLAAGLRPGRTALEKPRDDWAWAATLYARAASFMTINGSIDEYWMNKGYCFFRSRLRVQWKFVRETVCERLHREANEGVISAVKAARFKTVQLNVTGINLFGYSRPVLWGFLDEGVLSLNVGSGLLRLEIDTDPQNGPDFERAKSTAQNVRAANLVLGAVGSFLGKNRRSKYP